MKKLNSNILLGMTIVVIKIIFEIENQIIKIIKNFVLYVEGISSSAFEEIKFQGSYVC